VSYEKFYRYYDLVMGDRSQAARYIKGLIAHNNPEAKSVIEIACGTGGILGHLSESYKVAGLDCSTEMLAIARKRLPHVRFYRQDMTTFRLPCRFDAIVCAFDSINHLLRFADWERTFRSVQRHLNAGGLFIFDVNTLGKLRRLAEGPAWEKWFDRDLVIIKVAAAPRNQYIWDVKIFEHQRRERYDLIHDEIPEAAFPLRRIVGALRVTFDSVKVLDPFGARASDRSERLYFVCKAAKR
jgi:SAM-dependent methyltransferase